MKVLFINSCVRGKELSRTYKLAESFLKSWQDACGSEVIELTELILSEERLTVLGLAEINKRDELIARQEWSHAIFDYAHQFAQADRIIIAAPYWDLSFPAILKIYVENICVNGITFRYVSEGQESLCKADKLMYITTSGGDIGKQDYGTYYMAGLCDMFAIKGFQSIKAEGLDIQELDEVQILDEAKENARQIAANW